MPSPGPDQKAAIRRSIGGWGTWAALALVVSLAAVLWFQLRDFRDPFEPWGAELRLLATGTLWGKIWAAQMAIAVFTLAGFTLARARPAGGMRWTIATVFAFACGLMPALSGHSFGSERLQLIAVALDTVHVWAAGGWIGLLTVLALAARRHLRDATDLHGTLAEWVRAFSPVALVSFGVLALSGVFATWLHVGTLSHLFGSTYGRVLLTKFGLIGAVAALGAYNWKRITPILDSDEGEARFLGFSAPIEVMLGVLVLLVTAILVASALPMEGMG